MLNRETLYDAITNVKDELVMEAVETKPAKSRVRWLKFGSIAAAVAVVVTLGVGTITGRGPRLPIGGNASEGGSGHNEGSSTFMSYAGPVFPLTTVEGGEGLTAQREITYDFRDWMFQRGQPYYGLSTTDSYVLTNPTGEDKAVTLLYPFVNTLYDWDSHSHYPTLTLDGAELDAGLRIGQFSGSWGGDPDNSQRRLNPYPPDSWKDYKALLSDGSYLASALEDWPDLSGVPVTVYEITQPWAVEDGQPHTSNSYIPSLHAEMKLNDTKTTVLFYGFHQGSYDREAGVRRVGFSIPMPPAPDSSIDPERYQQERAEPHYVIVIGEPLDSFELLGTYDGDPQSMDLMEWGVEVGAGLRQYDTDLESALRAVFDWDNRDTVWDDPISADMMFGAMKDCLLTYGVLSVGPAERYSRGWLENLDYAVMERVLYLEAQVTIPAGGSVTVEASFLKEASYDFYCAHTKNQGVYGYDLVTKLGTNLDFTAQTARSVNTEDVEIVRQNFGFDWENGVNTVTLDPSVEHYYLEVRRIEKK